MEDKIAFYWGVNELVNVFVCVLFFSVGLLCFSLLRRLYIFIDIVLFLGVGFLTSKDCIEFNYNDYTKSGCNNLIINEYMFFVFFRGEVTYFVMSSVVCDIIPYLLETFFFRPFDSI